MGSFLPQRRATASDQTWPIDRDRSILEVMVSTSELEAAYMGGVHQYGPLYQSEYLGG